MRKLLAHIAKIAKIGNTANKVSGQVSYMATYSSHVNSLGWLYLELSMREYTVFLWSSRCSAFSHI